MNMEGIDKNVLSILFGAPAALNVQSQKCSRTVLREVQRVEILSTVNANVFGLQTANYIDLLVHSFLPWSAFLEQRARNAVLLRWASRNASFKSQNSMNAVTKCVSCSSAQTRGTRKGCKHKFT